MTLPSSQVDSINVILNAIQTGGLIAFLVMSIMAFVWEWIYPKGTVEEYKQQIKDLTAAVNSANTAMQRMADAWEARNDMDQQRADWDRRGRGDK